MSLGIKVDTDLQQAQKDIDNFSKRSRTALTSLSLVAQDLPFGFIAIQNNLPNVIQAFGELTTKSGGLIGALKGIGSALIGPSGIFLAFSAVTAGATYLIKEYGSLEAGIEALLGKTYSYTAALKEAQKSQKEYSDEARQTRDIENDAAGSYSASAIKLQALTDTVLDANKSDRERKNALEQLKELDKERFQNFDLEKGALKGLQEATDAYTESLIANAVAKQYEQEIGAATVNYNKQRDVLFDIQKEFDNLNSQYPDLADKAAKFNTELAKQATALITAGMNADAVEKVMAVLSKTAPPLVQRFNSINTTLTAQDKLVKNQLFPSLQKLGEEYKTVLSTITQGFIPKTDKSAQKALDKRNKELTDGFIEFYKSSSKLQDAANRAEYDATLALQTDRNKELLQLFTKYQDDLKALQLAGFTDSTNVTEAYNKQRLEINAKYDAEEAKRRDKIIKEAGKAELDAYLSTLSDRDAELFKREIKFYQDLAAVKKAGTTDFTLIEEGYRLDRLKINQKYDEKELRDFEKQQNKLKKQFEDIRSNLQTVFFNPLSDIFEKFLEDGTFTFEEFRKVVINNLKKMAAQLAATQIINTLASVLSGFTAGGTGSFLGNLLSGNLGSSMGNSGFQTSSIAAPNVGGISGGPLAMSGGVSLVLRGSDLVGSINRTNAQISRVG
jgi:hypothetical protein